MTFHDDPETASLYIELSAVASVRSAEVAPNVVLDFNGDGQVVGIHIDHASRHVALTRLEAVAPPIQVLALAGNGGLV